MKNVFSIYGIMDRNIFKYPGYVHDHNLCVSSAGKIRDYYHLERISRKKYDNTMHRSIEKLLFESATTRPQAGDLFLFVNSFVGSSFISENGRIRFDCNNQNTDLTKLEKGYCWIQPEPWEGFEAEAYSISHEIAHVFSAVAFAGELKENSLLISFDGGSSTGNFAAFHYKNGLLTQIESHWQLSQLSKLYNDNGLSFAMMNAEPGEHCSVPGKLMGYASWGKPDAKTMHWLQKHNYFRDAWGERHDFYTKARNTFGWEGNFDNNKDPFLFDLAACMQETFKKELLSKIIELAVQTGADYLYYAGGCALNIVANAELVTNKWFRDVFISPCCNDSGLSIGAACYWDYLHGQNLSVESPFINSYGCNADYNLSDDEILKTAEAIAAGKIVGICNGYAEAGPRALGNRSILCLASSKELSEKVSMQIKGREWYRPVAPIMLEKNAKIFTGLHSIHHLSEYMLLDFDILPQYKNELQGVVHSNGTARIQTIFSEKANPFMFRLLSHLDEQYQIRALINTSFNGKGEPIVQTTEDAINSAKAMSLDAVVINGKIQYL
ncbi:MAG TPA: carbamoyltransferase C-terminal domain-containing protein [Bacteroidales bacterium]|nr:carbamoyltransferase C-terminal domain-containing protein [Bacteroidales bacterium]